MFETRTRTSWNWSWTGIVFAVILILAVLQLVRVNSQADEQAASNSRATVWTEGEIVKGPIEVPAGELRSFRLNFNRRAKLSGHFTTGSKEKRLTCAIVLGSDLEKWRAGEPSRFVSDTGPVPSGVIKTVIEPGMYELVFDNRMNFEAMKIIDSEFIVE